MCRCCLLCFFFSETSEAAPALPQQIGRCFSPISSIVCDVRVLLIQEKLEEKKVLQEKYDSLTAELNQLKDRHSQLTVSLKNQKTQREELLMTQQSTQDKIKQILTFINSMKSSGASKAVDVS